VSSCQVLCDLLEVLIHSWDILVEGFGKFIDAAPEGFDLALLK
jgi:hypothetical protein